LVRVRDVLFLFCFLVAWVKLVAVAGQYSLSSTNRTMVKTRYHRTAILSGVCNIQTTCEGALGPVEHRPWQGGRRFLVCLWLLMRLVETQAVARHNPSFTNERFCPVVTGRDVTPFSMHSPAAGLEHNVPLSACLALFFVCDCFCLLVFCLFGGYVSKVSDNRTLPKPPLPGAVLGVVKGRILLEATPCASLGYLIKKKKKKRGLN
jgi:hypothetical protein